MALISGTNLKLNLSEKRIRHDFRIQVISTSRSIQHNLRISSESHVSTIYECRVPTSSEGRVSTSSESRVSTIDECRVLTSSEDRVSTSNEGHIFNEVRVQKKTK